MKELKKLIDVKTIITLTFTFLVAFLCISRGEVDNDILMLYGIIMSFYFGTQNQKDVDAIEKLKGGFKDED